MKRTTRLALGSGVVVGVVLALFLLPVVPISVEYACFAILPAQCPSISTFASVTYASFHVGAVYVSYKDGGRYCWMEGNPVGNPQVNNDAMCGSMVE